MSLSIRLESGRTSRRLLLYCTPNTVRWNDVIVRRYRTGTSKLPPLRYGTGVRRKRYSYYQIKKWRVKTSKSQKYWRSGGICIAKTRLWQFQKKVAMISYEKRRYESLSRRSTSLCEGAGPWKDKKEVVVERAPRLGGVLVLVKCLESLWEPHRNLPEHEPGSVQLPGMRPDR